LLIPDPVTDPEGYERAKGKHAPVTASN
jgi:hypothetical protein